MRLSGGEQGRLLSRSKNGLRKWGGETSFSFHCGNRVWMGDSSYPWAKATVFWNLPVPKWVAGRLFCWLAHPWGTKVNRSGKAWKLVQTLYSSGSLISCRKFSIIISSDAASALFSLLFFWSCNYMYIRSFDCVPHVSMFYLFSFSSYSLSLLHYFQQSFFFLFFSLDIFCWYLFELTSCLWLGQFIFRYIPWVLNLIFYFQF